MSEYHWWSGRKVPEGVWQSVAGSRSRTLLSPEANGREIESFLKNFPREGEKYHVGGPKRRVTRQQKTLLGGGKKEKVFPHRNTLFSTKEPARGVGREGEELPFLPNDHKIPGGTNRRLAGGGTLFLPGTNLRTLGLISVPSVRFILIQHLKQIIQIVLYTYVYMML